jgi:putative ABC transport system permease protein
MRDLLFCVARINARGLLRRPSNLAVALLGFSGLVFVLCSALSVRQGLQKLAESDIDNTQVIVFRSGVPTEAMSQISRDELLAIQRNLSNANITSIFSAEAVVPVDVLERGNAQSATITLRGLERPIERAGLGALKEGRWFAPGTNEIVVGARAARAYTEFSLGREVSWGHEKWRIVGVFDTGGTMADGEAWAYLENVQAAYSMGTTTQSLYFSYPEGGSLATLKKTVNQGVESDLDVQRARDFFGAQIRFIREYVQAGMLVLAIFMIACVFIATASIMESILQPRTKNYSVLNAIGISYVTVSSIVAMEGFLIGVIGGSVGMTAAYFTFNAAQVTTATATGQIAFALEVTLQAWIGLVFLSGIIGACGAWLAAKALRRGGSEINRITL